MLIGTKEWQDYNPISLEACAYGLKCRRIAGTIRGKWAEGTIERDRKDIARLGNDISRFSKGRKEFNNRCEILHGVVGLATAVLVARGNRKYIPGVKDADELKRLGEVLESAEKPEEFDRYARKLAKLFDGWESVAHGAAYGGGYNTPAYRLLRGINLKIGCTRAA